MPVSTIKKLVQEKGFGFIKAGEGIGQDVFFHHSVVTGATFEDLEEGQRVEFTIDPDAKGGKLKGPRAASVTPLG